MSRRSKAKVKFPKVDALTVDALFDRDPSRGAYGEWMVSRVAEGEHHETVLEAVLLWHGCKERLPKDGRDLYRYADTEAVQRAVDGAGPSRRKSKKVTKGYTLVCEYPRISFYRVDSFTGIKTLGRGTKWCLTKPSDFRHYADKTIVVAVSRLRPARDPYSKFAILSEEALNTDSNQFLSWETLKNRSRRGFRIGWNVWDAADRNPYRYGSHLAPLQEIMDTLAGRRGATDDALVAAVGGAMKIEAWTEVLQTLRGRVSASDAIHVAKEAAKLGLFNPLSMLDHPNVRSISAVEAIWNISTKKNRENLDANALEQLARRPAMNVPEILEMYWAQVRRGPYQPVGIIEPLIRNGRLTPETKERVARMFREDILRLPPVG